MFFKHSSKGVRKCDVRASGIVQKFPESPVNPMFKPRTLAELKALFDHTGINPAPVPLLPGVPEVDGLDPMDMPSRPIGGDVFETIRVGKALENDLRDKVDSYRANEKSQVVEPIMEPDKPAE